MARAARDRHEVVSNRLCAFLGLKPGSAVGFELAEDGRIVPLTTGKPPKSRLARQRSATKGRLSAGQIAALMRGKD